MAGYFKVATKRTSAAAALAALILLSGCREDMHVQPRYNPYDASSFFEDGRSERRPVPGTVARGHLHPNDLLHTGRVYGQLADEYPFPILASDLSRGRERFNIYCSPCHDQTGRGHGMIVARGFPAPPSYHLDRLRQAPVGHLFEVMTKGQGTMSSYAARVSVEDRWRIAAYIRALQLSQHAPEAELPAQDRARLPKAAP
jgi:mono/diheme cytochrome c family protein